MTYLTKYVQGKSIKVLSLYYYELLKYCEVLWSIKILHKGNRKLKIVATVYLVILKLWLTHMTNCQVILLLKCCDIKDICY